MDPAMHKFANVLGLFSLNLSAMTPEDKLTEIPMITVMRAKI